VVSSQFNARDHNPWVVGSQRQIPSGRWLDDPQVQPLVTRARLKKLQRLSGCLHLESVVVRSATIYLLYRRSYQGPLPSQADVGRAYTDRTQQRFCVDAIHLESEEDVTTTVAEINQCYQDHVDAFQLRSAYCMLSDTEYSDFDESDGDEEWEEYQQDYLDYVQSQEEEATQADVQDATDEGGSDRERKEVKVLPSQCSDNVHFTSEQIASRWPAVMRL